MTCFETPASCAPQHEEPKLAVAHLEAGYGDVQVLWDVTVEVGPGELVCLIGSNGAGKTTLLRSLSGLLPIIAGEILVDGRNMAQAGPADFVRAGMAHVPEGRRLFSAMSVRDNLGFGLKMRRMERVVPTIHKSGPAHRFRRSLRDGCNAHRLRGGRTELCADATSRATL